MSKGIPIDPHFTRHVGVAFEVVQPEFTDEEPTRGKGDHLAVTESARTISLKLGDRLILDLNRDTAHALGVALIVLSDGKGV